MFQRLQTLLYVIIFGMVTDLGAPCHGGDWTSAQSNAEGKWHILERIGKGFVAGEIDKKTFGDMPVLKKDLSEAERLENFDILWEAIDKHYSFFDLKKIDWQEVKKRYQPRVKAAMNSDDYYRVLFDLVNELKDFHSHSCNYTIDPPRFCPNTCTRQIEDKAVVTYAREGSEAYAKGLRPGAVITRIDGQSTTKIIEHFRTVQQAAFVGRNFLAIAYQRLLDGEKGSKVKVTFLPSGGGAAIEAELQRSAAMSWQQSAQFREIKFPVEKGKFVWSGTHPTGYGYIRIVSFEGREEIADEFDRAGKTEGFAWANHRRSGQHRRLRRVTISNHRPIDHC